MIEARKAIDAVGSARPKWPSEKEILGVERDKRTVDQRLGLVRHALFGLASPAAHGDDVAVEIKWDREKAMAVIAGVAALAACEIDQAAG